jgi:ATP-dependent Clp protease adapter protein ClpS
VSQLTLPDVEVDRTVEDDVASKVRSLFDEDFAVIIMDSDFTTFDEVERACMALFGYSRPDAEALSMRVHTTGEALAAVLAEPKARQAVRQLRRRNVLARVEKV